MVREGRPSWTVLLQFTSWMALLQFTNGRTWGLNRIGSGKGVKQNQLRLLQLAPCGEFVGNTTTMARITTMPTDQIRKTILSRTMYTERSMALQLFSKSLGTSLKSGRDKPAMKVNRY